MLSRRGLAIGLLVLLAAEASASAEPEIVLFRHNEAAAQDRFAALQLEADQEYRIEVFVTDRGAGDTPLFGFHSRAGDRLEFYPRFQLQPGLTYQVNLRSGENRWSARFTIPKRRVRPSTVVSQVYPTSDVLPENQLKFYLHFSAPMSRGEAYERIQLVKLDAGPIEFPFLELGEELWDHTGTRFTLFFDPGRVKRGLKPREEVGPALEEDGRYELRIDARWQDARGVPLADSFIKSFRVTEPDYQQPRPFEWKLHVPQAGSRTPLRVTFLEPLDHGMLQRVLRVEHAHSPVPGEVNVTAGETAWEFTPRDPWPSGKFDLVVQTNLEDRAGNSIAKPFEVDLFRKVEQSVDKSEVTLEFVVNDKPRP